MNFVTGREKTARGRFRATRSSGTTARGGESRFGRGEAEKERDEQEEAEVKGKAEAGSEWPRGDALTLPVFRGAPVSAAGAEPATGAPRNNSRGRHVHRDTWGLPR